MAKKKKTSKKERKELPLNHKPPEVEPESSPPAGDRASFPIVGIGASAGGIEACTKFFAEVPDDCGMAFVLIQHMSPSHKSSLAELLQKHTKMKVSAVENTTLIEPNRVYINPPDKELSVFHRTLQPQKIPRSPVLRMPIDLFFRSLAEDQEERVIGIILSGTGSDGTLGLKAIKGAGGITLAQAPEEALYDSMPGSAIATGLMDAVLPIKKMVPYLLNYAKHALPPRKREDSPGVNFSSEALDQIFALLRSHRGHDFSGYKQNTLCRRIDRRMSLHQIGDLPNYLNYLHTNPLEKDLLFRDFLIGVTSFFRDAEAFEALKEKALNELLKNRKDPLRVWISGCSTGEEAYSMAMLIQECLTEAKLEVSFQIFASDIDSESIEKARAGAYPLGIISDVSPERLSRFFKKEEDCYIISKSIRDKIVFAVQNVIKDPPFSNLDLISCRNLLIYLTMDLQKKIFPLFHYALKKGGHLFLGNAESLGDAGELFSPIDRMWKIFRKEEVFQSHPLSKSVLGAYPFRREVRYQNPTDGKVPPKKNIREILERILLENHSPSALIVNEGGDILYIHGRTGKYLEPAQGEAHLNIFSMARPGLALDLSTTIRKASQQRKEFIIEGLEVKVNGGFQMINLTVRPFWEAEDDQKVFLVILQDWIPGKSQTRKEGISKEKTEETSRVMSLEQELSSTREYLQRTIEELETSNEEMKSTNEELQSSNEELQSTIEELDTSKEELQSVNEEVVTVNTQNQSKIEELSRVNDDLQNLLSSTEIATIFLDRDLGIKGFTPSTTKLINLIPADIGRPISHIVSNLDYRDLIADGQKVLDTLVFREREVKNRDGRWYSMRIFPYRTVENVIDGLVITFVDISRQKLVEEELFLMEEQFDRVLGEFSALIDRTEPGEDHQKCLTSLKNLRKSFEDLRNKTKASKKG